MIYPRLSDGTIDWCVMCKHEGRAIYDGCCECEYSENSDDPPAKYEPKPITNADRIRSMSDDELAEWCFIITYNVACYYQGDEKLKYPVSPLGWLDWLKQEVSTNG